MDSAEEQSRARAPPKPTAYLFRGFALDSIRGVLVRPDGCEIALRPKSTEVLCHLARHAAQVVPRDDLMETVWAKVSVTDDSLTQCVAEIRRALGDEGAHLLRTLPKRGYTLAAEVTPGGSVPADGTPPAAMGEAVAPPARDPAPARPRRRRSVLVGAGLLAMALVAAMS